MRPRCRLTTSHPIPVTVLVPALLDGGLLKGQEAGVI